MGIQDSFKRRMGWAVIDWSGQLARNKLQTEHATIDFKRSVPADLPCAWGPLISVVRSEFELLDVVYWPVELEALKKALFKEFHIVTSIYPPHSFDDDFALFTHFIYLSFNQGKSAPPFNGGSTEPLKGNDEQYKLTQYAFSYLLDYHVRRMIPSLSIETLLKHTNELKGLSELAPWDEKPSRPNVPSIWESLRAWLTTLFHYLKTIFLRRAADNGSPEAYVETANNLWALAKACNLDLQTPIEASTIGDLLFQAYQTDAGELPQRSLQLKACLKRHREAGTPQPVVDSFSIASIKSLSIVVQTDLKTLSSWAIAHVRCAILVFQSNPEKGLANYLTAFQLTQKCLHALSADLYTFRNEVEYYLRSDSNNNYLSVLNAFDKALREIHQQFTATNIEWLKEAEYLVPRTELAKASECLLTLLTEAVQELDNLNWAEHTAYCPERTEEKLAYEMNLLKVTPGAYHLKTTYTQTDYLINHHWQQYANKARAEMIRIHPDKFQAEPRLIPIANFCIHVIDQKRKRCTDLTRSWRISQWFDPNLFPEVEPAIRYDDDALKANIAKEPQEPLMLGVLELHQQYLKWIKAQKPLVKSPQEVRMQDHLYDGPEDPIVILILNRAKIQCPILEANIVRQDAKKQELDAKKQELDAKKQDLDAKLQELGAALLLEKESKNQSIFASINGEIEERLPTNEEERTPVVIEQLRTYISKKITKIFSLPLEQSAAYVDECLKGYLPAQTLVEPLIAGNPAGLHAQPTTAQPTIKVAHKSGPAAAISH